MKSGETLVMLVGRKVYLAKGSGNDDCILDGMGWIVALSELLKAAEHILGPEFASLHVRSAADICFNCPIDRAWQ